MLIARGLQDLQEKILHLVFGSAHIAITGFSSSQHTAAHVCQALVVELESWMQRGESGLKKMYQQ